MFKRLKHFRKIWEASKNEAYIIPRDSIIDPHLQDVLDRNHKQLLDNAARINHGSGKAVFLPDMLEEDYQEYLREQQGWKKWLGKFKSFQ